jgi:hypothetical protein
MTEVVTALARGSISVMCRADVPAARRWLDPPAAPEVGSAHKDRRLWAVMRVSTTVEVSRSSVLSVWSSEAEYATVGSSGWKITLVAAWLWAAIRDSGPRCGVDVAVVSFLRLAEGREEEIRVVGAAGEADLDVVQSPMEPSVEAERMREEGACTARESMLPVWPYSSRMGFRSPEKWSEDSVYFQTRTVRSRPADAI